MRARSTPGNRSSDVPSSSPARAVSRRSRTVVNPVTAESPATSASSVPRTSRARNRVSVSRPAAAMASPLVASASSSGSMAARRGATRACPRAVSSGRASSVGGWSRVRMRPAPATATMSSMPIQASAPATRRPAPGGRRARRRPVGGRPAVPAGRSWRQSTGAGPATIAILMSIDAGTLGLIARMPKAELHLHLDGSLRASTALELARERGLDQGMDVGAMRVRLTAPMPCVDQRDLLRAFDLPIRLMQDAEALERVTHELVEDVATDGTRYVEIRWAPSLHVRRGLSLGDGIAAVVAGAASGAAATGVVVRLIAVALRTLDPDDEAAMARAAADFVGDGLTGFDCAGREADAPGSAALPRGVRDRARRGPGHHLPRGRMGRRGAGLAGAGPGAVAHRPRLTDRGRPGAHDGADRARRDPRPVSHQQRPGGHRRVPGRAPARRGCIGPGCR